MRRKYRKISARLSSLFAKPLNKFDWNSRFFFQRVGKLRKTPVYSLQPDYLAVWENEEVTSAVLCCLCEIFRFHVFKMMPYLLLWSYVLYLSRISRWLNQISPWILELLIICLQEYVLLEGCDMKVSESTLPTSKQRRYFCVCACVRACVRVLSTGLEVVTYSHSCLLGIIHYFASIVCCGVNVDCVAQCHSYAIRSSPHIYIHDRVFFQRSCLHGFHLI